MPSVGVARYSLTDAVKRRIMDLRWAENKNPGAKMILRGMATVSFFTDDIDAAREWYSKLLGIQPYFVRPETGPAAYIEYRIGDYEHELGIIDRRYSPHAAVTDPAGAVLFWHVDDVEETVAKLLALGAREHEPITPREAGFVTASVVDPFGNILGVMQNPHYQEILELRSGSMLGE
ncbi:VOC family protein [Mycetocola manganoxydans]|uniref:VOC family protein n=2 Tax=Mycetocola manganoxydans TaxID=699879 RepID=UPI001E3A7881|nr:VOC family protein [Mycetocola manganoxydans]